MIRGYIIILYNPVLFVRHLGKSLLFVRRVQRITCSSAKVTHLYFLSPIAVYFKKKEQ